MTSGKAERKERAQRLRDAGEAAQQRFLDRQCGREAEVLVEKPGFGHSRHFAEVRLQESTASVGDLVAARITGRENTQLIAEAL